MTRFILGAVTVCALYLAGWQNVERVGVALGAAAATVIVNVQSEIERAL